jgi:hypothetical protein
MLCVWRLRRRAAAPPSWFLFQPRQPVLYKALDPLVDMATVQADSGGHIGDRHPVSQEQDKPAPSG